MEKIDYGKDFNVGVPSRENIEYAFKNLFFYVNGALCLDIYQKQKKAFEQVEVKLKHILSMYVNGNSLSIIDEETLQDVKFDLIDLDDETKLLKSYYAEWSLMWLEALMSLRISEIKWKEENVNRYIEDKIINLYRKIICSLSCMEKKANNSDVTAKINEYLTDFINQYELYKNKRNINSIKFLYDIETLIDFCNECYENVDIFDYAEDVEYGIKELMEIINEERRG